MIQWRVFISFAKKFSIRYLEDGPINIFMEGNNRPFWIYNHPGRFDATSGKRKCIL